jgi:hypothetical protein
MDTLIFLVLAAIFCAIIVMADYYNRKDKR